MRNDNLPTTWRLTTLGDIVRQDEYGLVDGPFGSNLPASLYVETGVPVIRGSNLSLGTNRFKDDEFVFVSADTAHQLRRSLCRGGDIIFTKKGTLGQTGFVPYSHRYDSFLLSSNQMKLSVDRTIADPLFVYYYVSSPASQAKIIRDSEATGVPKTNVAYLRTFPINLPPLPEQRAIAAVLGALDDKIELNRRINQTLEQMAQALFNSWFVDFDPVHANRSGERLAGLAPEVQALFPSEFEESELGLVPRGWRVGQIGNHVRIVGGSTPSTKEPAYWAGGAIHWATPKDLSTLTDPILLNTERKITAAGLSMISSGLLPAGTVLLSSRAPIGYLAIAQMPVAVNQGFIAMVCDLDLPNYYVLHWAQFNMDVIIARANGTTFLEVSKANFRPLPILLPDQRSLATFKQQVGLLYDRVVSNLNEMCILATIREVLLPKLLSGEVRVRDAEHIVEELM